MWWENIFRRAGELRLRSGDAGSGNTEAVGGYTEFNQSLDLDFLTDFLGAKEHVKSRIIGIGNDLTMAKST